MAHHESASAQVGPAAVEAILLQLPTLDDDAIQRLLVAEDIESLLLGMHAARELDAIHLLEPVTRLAQHPDATIAREADRCATALLQSAIARGADDVPVIINQFSIRQFTNLGH